MMMNFCMIVSIHAPSEGSDAQLAISGYETDGFQSTLPVKGATASTPLAGIQVTVSIHAPSEGSDEAGRKSTRRY